MTSANGTRKFVCQTISLEGYPAKDQSGKLEVFEGADLGKLLKKIKEQSNTDNVSETIKQIKELAKSIGE